MAKQPFDFFSDPQIRRPYGEIAWLLSAGELRESTGSGGRRWKFVNGLAMYVHYMQGYLQGNFWGPEGTRFVVVRHEDVLEHQEALVGYFVSYLYLPRNRRPFTSVFHAWGSSGLSPAELVVREREALTRFDEAEKERIRELAVPYAPLWEALAYPPDPWAVGAPGNPPEELD